MIRLNLDFLTIFTIVKQSMTNELSDNEIYRRLICLGNETLDGKNDPHRHITGETQISGAKNSSIIAKSSLETMAYAYDSLFANYMSVPSRKRMISALKGILKSYGLPGPEEELGEGSGFTRDSVINGREFCFPKLLAALVKFVVARPNPHRKDFKEYRAAVEEYYRTVPEEIIDLIPIEVGLPKETDTAKLDMAAFRRLFTEVRATKLPEQFKNPNDIRIFRLNMRNSFFDYEGLSGFLEDNVEHYVMSSLEEKSYYDGNRTKRLTHDAITKFVESTTGQDFRDVYSRLMLYVFMECGLGAPKIFNTIEVKDRDIRSDGVYYLRKGAISDKPMLVLGASKAFADLDEAMENALAQVDVISRQQEKVLSLINPQFLKMRFEKDDLSYIVNRLVNAEGLLENDASFGIFLSYSLNEENDGSLSSGEFANKVEERMEKDIGDAVPVFYEKIRRHGLQNYAFFVFVLPLSKVEADVEKVIRGFAGDVHNG